MAGNLKFPPGETGSDPVLHSIIESMRSPQRPRVPHTAAQRTGHSGPALINRFKLCCVNDLAYTVWLNRIQIACVPDAGQPTPQRRRF